MEFTKQLYYHFDFLTKNDKYISQKEFNDGHSYSIEYFFIDFVIKIEKYNREFYLSIYKKDDEDSEVNLFNLIDYLYQDYPTLEAEYFKKEQNIEECFRKQFIHLSKVLFDNFDEITEFFKRPGYKAQLNNLRENLIQKYPDLFKRGTP